MHLAFYIHKRATDPVHAVHCCASPPSVENKESLKHSGKTKKTSSLRLTLLIFLSFYVFSLHSTRFIKAFVKTDVVNLLMFGGYNISHCHLSLAC